MTARGVVAHAVFGSAGAERLVVLLREGPTATTDPDAVATLRHDVRVFAVRVDATEVLDDSTFGGQNPAESAVDALERLVAEQLDRPPLGLVAVGGAAAVGLLLAERLQSAVDRIALVAAPAPDSPLDRDLAREALVRLAVDALVVHTDAAAAGFYVDALPRAHAEIVPGDERGPGLATAWAAVLDHVAAQPV